MKLLIVYATYSGGTQQVAELLKEVYENKGMGVVLLNVFETSENGEYVLNPNIQTEIESTDFIVFGSCTWKENGIDGQPHSGFLALFEKLKNISFAGKSFAIYGLGDKNYFNFAGSVDHLEKFVTEHKGLLVVPSLRINQFYFHEEENLDKARVWAESVIATGKKTALQPK